MVKYGKVLRAKRVPAWAEHYIEYTELKQLIKRQTLNLADETVPSFFPYLLSTSNLTPTASSPPLHRSWNGT